MPWLARMARVCRGECADLQGAPRERADGSPWKGAGDRADSVDVTPDGTPLFPELHGALLQDGGGVLEGATQRAPSSQETRRGRA